MDADLYDDSYEDEYYPEWLEDGDIDEDQLAELMGAYGHDFEPEYEIIPVQQLLEQCVVPAITQTVQSLLPLLISCFIFRMVCIMRSNPSEQELGLPTWCLHLTSGCFGLFVLHMFFDKALVYFVINAGAIYAVILMTSHWKRTLCGVLVSSAVVFNVVFCELYMIDGVLWHSIRGCQMVLSMKVISLSFDITNCVVEELPSITEYFGYVFNVGTVIFGPWCSFTDYKNIIEVEHVYFSFSWFINFTFSCLMSFICLIYSSCFSQWLIMEDNYRWVVAYRDAQSFRFSHYFISFTSQATALLCGFGATYIDGDIKWNKAVTKPFHIELPRSLVQVVTNWNLPMHYWLKTYVFKTAKPLGTFVAVLMTYAASSLLHGLNFQLAAVLFSLGFYSYVEYVFRNRLAKIYSACIKAKRCNEECDHMYKTYHPVVIVVNVGFGLLTVFHLAYLGLMFDSSSEEQKGYTMEHTLSKWSSLDFASHWVALGTFIIYWLV